MMRAAVRTCGRVLMLAAMCTPARLHARAPALLHARTQHPPPALVVVISVDQFRGDYFDRYGAQFTGGLARLAREGALFSNAHQDHAMTATAAGHASVTSGRYPASTGIISNAWGVGDTANPLVGVPGAGASPHRMRGSTVFDWMKSRWPQARALGAGGDDRNVIPLIGRAREQVYWSVEGRFVTSRYYCDSLPAWVTAFNAEAAPVVRAPRRVWDLLLPASAYPEPDSIPWENRGVSVAFPHVGPAEPERAARYFRYMPWGDSLALAFVLRGVGTLGLGRGTHPDMVAIGLATADDIGHAFGPDSREVRDYFLRLDRWLGVFLDSLDRLVQGRPITVVLTSDHGVTPFPETAWARGDSVPRHVRLDTLLNRWQSLLQYHVDEGRYILWYSSGMIAMDRGLLTRRGVRMDTLLSRMADDLRRVAGVARVQTRADLARRADTTQDAVTRRWRRTVDRDSPAELFVTLGRGSDFSASGGSAQHGQNSDLDAHVALVLWGAGVRPGRYDGKVAVVDIAPTLARILGVEVAERVDGRVLIEAITDDR